MMRRLIKIDEVARRTATPKASIYWRIQRNEFPRPVKVGERSSAWLEEEVEQWIEARINGSRGGAKAAA